MTIDTTPAQRAEQAGHAEALAMLNAMHQAMKDRLNGQQAKHPALHLTELLCELANHTGEHREAFIAGVSVALSPWLELALRGSFAQGGKP
jgi:uncharacterized protein (DUF2267 family)